MRSNHSRATKVNILAPLRFWQKEENSRQAGAITENSSIRRACCSFSVRTEAFMMTFRFAFCWGIIFLVSLVLVNAVKSKPVGGKKSVIYTEQH